MRFPEDIFFSNTLCMVEPDFELYHYLSEVPPVIETHFHDFIEVYMLLSGNVTYLVDGIQYHLRPFDIIIVNKDELHRPIIEPGPVYERIDFFIRPEFILSKNNDGLNLMRCFERESGRSQRHLLRPSDDKLHKIIDAIVRVKSLAPEKDYGYHLLRETYLTELLVYLNQSFMENREVPNGDDIVSDELIDRVIAYINSHLKDDLSLETLAERFYTSKFYFSRKFKKCTSCTLHQYVNYKRLLAARVLLRSGCSVTTACYECGFADYSNFIRAFKTTFGSAPKRYSQNEVDRGMSSDINGSSVV